VLAADLVAGAPKLGASAQEIGLLLARSGFASEPGATGSSAAEPSAAGTSGPQA